PSPRLAAPTPVAVIVGPSPAVIPVARSPTSAVRPADGRGDDDRDVTVVVAVAVRVVAVRVPVAPWGSERHLRRPGTARRLQRRAPGARDPCAAALRTPAQD